MRERRGSSGRTGSGGHRLGATVAVVVAAVALGVVALAGGATAGHGGTGNYTVAFDAPADHAPGEDNASAALLSVNTKDIAYLEEAAFRYPAGVPSRCFQSDVRVLGIDRGNDDPGDSADETVLPFASGTQRSQHEVVIEFTDQDDPTGTSTNLAAGDQFILSVADCLQNPDEPGWYQQESQFTGADVESPAYTSHYFWICDCANESEARQQLGPPPSEATPTPEPTATATATPTPEPTATTTASPTATRTATATASPTATRTATATPTSTAMSEATPTPTAAPATATATPTAEATPTPTATAATAGDSGESSPEPGTATSGSGPGFGAAGALAALGTVTLLARRRWSR